MGLVGAVVGGVVGAVVGGCFFKGFSLARGVIDSIALMPCTAKNQSTAFYAELITAVTVPAPTLKLSRSCSALRAMAMPAPKRWT